MRNQRGTHECLVGDVEIHANSELTPHSTGWTTSTCSRWTSHVEAFVPQAVARLRLAGQ